MGKLTHQNGERYPLILPLKAPTFASTKLNTRGGDGKIKYKRTFKLFTNIEKKKMAKALMLTATLAGGITVAQSFYNEAHATGKCDLCVIKVYGVTVASCMAKPGVFCSNNFVYGQVSCNNAVAC